MNKLGCMNLVYAETNPTAGVAEIAVKEHKDQSVIRSLRITRSIYSYSTNTFINYLMCNRIK
jgi:hypothetical protein